MEYNSPKFKKFKAEKRIQFEHEQINRKPCDCNICKAVRRLRNGLPQAIVRQNQLNEVEAEG